MAIPGKVKGAGNLSTAQNVIKVVFSEQTSDAPKLEAWDDFNFNAVLHEIFTGTINNGGVPMLSGVGTLDSAPASDWKPASATAGGANPNRLKGNTNYVNLCAAALAAGEHVLFNLCWEIPDDASVPADLDCVLRLVYSYAGAAPVLAWYFNDESAGGTEAVPVWTELTPGASGHILRPTDAGVSSDNLVLTKPVSGVLDNPEMWLAAA